MPLLCLELKAALGEPCPGSNFYCAATARLGESERRVRAATMGVEVIGWIQHGWSARGRYAR